MQKCKTMLLFSVIFFVLENIVIFNGNIIYVKIQYAIVFLTELTSILQISFMSNTVNIGR